MLVSVIFLFSNVELDNSQLYQSKKESASSVQKCTAVSTNRHLPGLKILEADINSTFQFPLSAFLSLHDR